MGFFMPYNLKKQSWAGVPVVTLAYISSEWFLEMVQDMTYPHVT